LILALDTPSRRSRFGDAMLVAFIVAQALDGILTYVGITTFGTSAEANPVVAWYVTTFGAVIGLAAIKGLAVACAAALHLNARHFTLGGLTLLYIAAAVVPWTRILL
jgi:hypothetical protein